MEKELKLVLQIAVALVVVWALAKVFRKSVVHAHHKNDPTQFSQASRVWSPSLVSKPYAVPYSQMPQSALYAQ